MRVFAACTKTLAACLVVLSLALASFLGIPLGAYVISRVSPSLLRFLIAATVIFFFLVLRENRFAGRTVEVERGQKLITTGPYAVVRHPMYAAIMPLYLFTPLALGSYWALLPALLIPVILVARIFNEERFLSRELEGYEEYTRRVKYRLIPGIW